MRLLRWVVINGAMALFLYLGFFEGMVGFERIVVFFSWLTGLLALGVIAKAEQFAAERIERGETTPSVHPWVDGLYDIIFLCTLVYCGAVLTGVAYFFSAIGSQVLMMEVKKQIRGNTNE